MSVKCYFLVVCRMREGCIKGEGEGDGKGEGDGGSREYPEKGLMRLSACKQYPMEMALH